MLDNASPVTLRDPPERRRIGAVLGRGCAAVATSLRSLHEVGVREVGAVITDGNTASERLFTSLGFVRVGSWG